jgi:cell division septum initiation protein DivIVA
VSDAIWKAPDGYVDYRDYHTLESRVRELEAKRDRLKVELEYQKTIEEQLDVINEGLRARHAVLVKAAKQLVNNAQNADQELWASLPDVIAPKEALVPLEEKK